jgi:hypothetical protein
MTNTNPKYALTLTVRKGTETLYNGDSLMDVIFPLLPKEGRFTIDFEHENLHGFAKILALVNVAGNLIGAKILTKADYRACAITGTDIPKVTRIEFTSPASAIATIYVAMIPRMVSGNWKAFPEDSQAALVRFLEYIKENGINMFLNTGAFCSGRLMPLKQAKAKATVVESIITAKRAIAGTKGKESKPEVKQSAVARPKAKAKAKTARPTKKEVVKEAKAALETKAEVTE